MDRELASVRKEIVSQLLNSCSTLTNVKGKIQQGMESTLSSAESAY